MDKRASFEDWWVARGSSLYPQSAKEGLWIVFADGWYRGQKAYKAEQETGR